MQFEGGATVRAQGGQTVGQVASLVIDPSTQKVTHLVVKTGLFFPQDRVIPLYAVEGSEKETVWLRSSEEELEGFPPFEAEHYVSLGQEDLPPQWGNWAARPLLYYPPLDARPTQFDPVVGYPPQKETHRNVPPERVAINEKTRVITAEGDPAGTVERTFTNAEGHITHVLVSKGFIFPTYRLIPSAWIDWISAAEIRLLVPTELVQRLEAYQGE
ncbi:MAG: PRC-barrel domain containing protein [Anaerolineae bacterium]|nr:PRC-barrel domain containing protein [Anaerolineae bacterium]